ncbi:hypothetical protein SAMN04488128_103223 [Chitinophaga eiseniae]|uniref:Uncharacterized protein n=1 Tax=Chitinophaga eiseniae TaxID=634771 RepID=A0A1T4SPK8_9BACT|nr:hypothetical protein [Chitinophaga eiseniae]SKA30107.1 hypothetical protein SAMN04488128_103223 [Chitinophaga eiseniae]
MANYPKTTRIKMHLGLLLVDTDLTVYDDNYNRTGRLFYLEVVDPKMKFTFIKKSDGEPFELANGDVPNNLERDLLSQLEILFRTDKHLFEQTQLPL